jgi:hypothetical protein
MLTHVINDQQCVTFDGHCIYVSGKWEIKNIIGFYLFGLTHHVSYKI